MDEHKKALESSNADLQAKQAEIRQQELDVEALHEKIKKLRTQQLDIKTNREFKAIESEIDNLNTKINGFEDKELVMMEALEALKGDVSIKEEELAAEKKFVDEDVVLLDQRLKEMESTLNDEKQKRELIAKDVDPEWLERYNIIQSRKSNALVKLENGICSGCHMRLPPAAIQSIKKSNIMTFCDFCGRMLY
jgi:predicted  nucleic acid-binding Zn-ribbon protein